MGHEGSENQSSSCHREGNWVKMSSSDVRSLKVKVKRCHRPLKNILCLILYECKNPAPLLHGPCPTSYSYYRLQ